MTTATEIKFSNTKDADLHRLFEDLGPVATRWYQHAITLSNPFFEGRAPGLRGNDLAAEYLQWWRLQLAAQRLRETQDSVVEIAMAVGYDNASAFARVFKRVMSESPTGFRARVHQDRAG